MALIYEKGDNYVLFGDGTQSRLAEWLEYQDPLTGKALIRILLWPSKEQISRYHLLADEDIDPINGLCYQEYSIGYVEFLELNPTKMRIFVSLSFDGKPTKSSRRREDYVSDMEQLEKINESLRVGIASLHEELEVERSRTLDSMKQKVDIFNEANKVRAHPKTDEEGDEEESG